MLSDEQMDRKIREHAKAHPVILPEDYQTMVQEQIRKCCEKEMQMNTNVKKQRKENGSGSVHCVMHWSVWRRRCTRGNELCKTTCGADVREREGIFVEGCCQSRCGYIFQRII